MKYGLLVSAALCCAATAPRAEQDIYGEYWDYELGADPFLATTSGDRRFSDRVPDVSERAQRAHLERLQAFASRLDAAVAETPENSLDADILGFILKHELALGEFAPWRIPFLADAGFHMDMGYVVSSTRFETVDDYLGYMS